MNNDFSWDEMTYVANGADEENNPRSAANIIIYRKEKHEMILESQRFLKGAILNLYVQGGCMVLEANFSVLNQNEYHLCMNLCNSYQTQCDEKVLSVVFVPLLLEGDIFLVFQNLVYVTGDKREEGYEGVFTTSEVQAELEMLFEKQYILTETTETETRYRTETRTGTQTVTDPETGETTTEEYEYEVEVPYTYYIRVVELENFDLSHVPVYIMGEETLSLYATYMATLGNREDLFPTSSYVAKYTNPPATYDIPASALEDETFAALIAEAEKYIGYPYVWGGSSPSTSFDCSGFVSWVLTESGVCNTGRLGAQGLYNISTPVSSASARPGIKCQEKVYKKYGIKMYN